MANTLRIKRRATGNAGAPTSLENAELAFNEVDNILYYGKGTGGAGGSATTVEAIGGYGAYTTLSTTQTISESRFGLLQISHNAVSEILWHLLHNFTSLRKCNKASDK